MDSIDKLGVAGTVLNLSGSPLVALLPLSWLGWAVYAAGATVMVVYAAWHIKLDKEERRRYLNGKPLPTKVSWWPILVQMAWFLCWNAAAIITRLA